MGKTPDFYLETFDIPKSSGILPRSRFYFRMKARNGEIVMPSQGYTRRASRDRIVARISLKHGFDVRKGKA